MNLLEIRGLTKEFPGQLALAGVDLDVRAGEVLGLAGANGSGKSTLIKILAGFHAPDAGELVAFGERVPLSGGTWRHRCHFIHQDLALIGTLSAVDNLALGSGYRVGRLGRIRWAAQRAAARRAIRGFGGDFDVNVPVAQLTPAERTIVAIARALDRWKDPDAVLVVDEATASLHRDEVDKLFRAIRTVARHGAGVVFVSHRIDELLDLTDRIAVLRDGQLAGVGETADLTEDKLVTLIVGRSVDELYSEAPPVREDVVLRVRDLIGERIRGVSFDVHSGEILGVSGLLGSGREELTTLLGGGDSRLGGEIILSGEPLRNGSVAAAIKRGLVMVPSDRARRGAVMNRSLRENIMLADPWWGSDRGLIRRGRERREVNDWIGRLQVRPPNQDLPLVQLSGGNQQKVVLAKWLRLLPKVVVLDEPTQGIDVGAKAAIYALIADAARDGASVIVCSSEAKDLAAICDRVLVLSDGLVCAELHHRSLTEHAITSASVRPAVTGVG